MWHWLFGDQLGPHFLTAGEDGPARDAPVLMIEARSVFRRRRFHRAKAHLLLSAMRHRAAEHVRVLPARGFLLPQEAFRTWAEGRERLRHEDFYRWTRQELGLLVDGDEPAGGRWNHDQAKREPPPKHAASLRHPHRTGRGKATSTRRYAPTWTAGSETRASTSSAATVRAPSPPRAAKRWPRCTGSSSAAWPLSDPTRTRCSPATR